ncbi:MAG: response regulator [Bacteroidetes bacterium]|jgi:PAS domain S-box-containing protein|nr:response regulator [Bacteroidota bacterium]
MDSKQYKSQLEAIFDKSNMPVCCIDHELNIVYRNAQFEKIVFKNENSAHLKSYISSYPFYNRPWIQEQISRKCWRHIFTETFDDAGNYSMHFIVNIEKLDDRYVLFITLSEHRDVTNQINNPAISNLAEELINNIPDNIFAKDKDHRFILANKGVATLMGKTDPAELLGKTDFEFFPHSLAKIYCDDENRVMTTGEPQFGKEEEVPDANGIIQWYSTTKVPLRNEQEEIIGVLGIGRNITSQREEKEAIKEAKRMAEMADQLKSAFLANMSHELRTPLNGILGFAQFLRQESLPTAKKAKYVDIIFYNGKHLLSVINNIIDVAKIDTGEIFINKQPFALNPLLYKLNQYFNELLDNKMKKDVNLTLETSFTDLMCQVYSDQNRLYQILENLLNNAIKFTDSGDITLGYRTYNEDSLLFYVKDTGTGIPTEKQEIIFHKFRQADDSLTRRHGGTGLGLAIAKGLVEILGGEIWFESVYHEGTTFYFTIPYQQKEEADISEKPVQLHKKWQHKSILIVEDDNMSFKYLDTLFRHHKLNVTHADDGLKAVKLSGEKSFDLIIMDLRLPEIDGLEATRRIKKVNNKIPIIALTAFAYDNDEQNAFEAGCDYYVSKPINKLRLFEIMNKISFK